MFATDLQKTTPAFSSLSSVDTIIKGSCQELRSTHRALLVVDRRSIWEVEGSEKAPCPHAMPRSQPATPASLLVKAWAAVPGLCLHASQLAELIFERVEPSGEGLLHGG